MTTPLKRNLPNLLTIARLIFAIAFFATLTFYQYPHQNPLLLDVALVLFIVAAVTDWLDGALARHWNVVSIFGRIMDPVCDKVLVIGAFVFLAAPMFVYEPTLLGAGEALTGIEPGGSGTPAPEYSYITGVYPWMVVLILGRELLITAIRGLMEAQGVAFGASWFGKAKMILQSIVIPIIIFTVAHLNPQETAWAANTLDVLVYLTLFVTVASGWPYVTKTFRVATQSTKK